MNNVELAKAQHHYLALCGSPSQARHKHLSLCLLTDPLWRQAVGPVLVWSSIVWKAATARELFAVWPFAWLGQEAGKIVRSLPSTWAAVRGPLGAAYLSIRRVGWTFATPFQLIDAAGITINLKGTSPAMVAHRLRQDWNRLHLEGARRSLRMDDSLYIEFEASRALLLDRRISAQARGILNRYLTQTLWTCERLYHVGYDMVQGCPLCGHHRDDLHHRLFNCPATHELRLEHLHTEDVEYLRPHPHLLFGCQVIPPVPRNRPADYGHLEYCAYTCDDKSIQEHFEGAVLYSDGSCNKLGHVSMHRAGWALVKLTDTGDLAAAIWGQVGDRLPQTSPASEFVAGLAASGFRAREVRTDFAGLASLGIASYEALANRRNLYSGVRIQIKGRCPHLGLAKVKGHVDPASCTVGSPD